MSTLLDLENEHSRLQRRLREVESEIYNLKLKEAGLLIGGIVVGTEGRYKGTRVQIASVRFGYGTPWIEGFMQKKDGTWGRRIHLYDDWAKEDAA